jgi:TatD DNase family protein
MIDTHSHIYLKEFDEDRVEVVERALANGVEKILLPNIDAKSVSDMLQLVDLFPGVCHAMMGLHPTSVNADFESQLTNLKEVFGNASCVAVGEVGIDLYWDQTYKDQQMEAFEEQMRWAKQMHLPVVIHCRDAFSEVFQSVEKLMDADLKGVFHSFSGDVMEAQRILEYESFFLGINGVVTFKNSNLREVLKEVPLSKVVLETDAPYLTPVPFRGKRNESSYVKYICEELTKVYDLPFSMVDEVTTQNARQLFSL